MEVIMVRTLTMVIQITKMLKTIVFTQDTKAMAAMAEVLETTDVIIEDLLDPYFAISAEAVLSDHFSHAYFGTFERIRALLRAGLPHTESPPNTDC